MAKIKKQLKTFFPLIIILLLLSITSLIVPKDPIQDFIKSTGMFAPILFILILLVTFIFAMLGGSSFMAIGYFLFGKDVVIYGYITSVIAAVINFWIGRNWGRGLVLKLTKKEVLKSIDKFANIHGVSTLIFSRLMLNGLSDLISYAAGLTNMEFAPYIIVSILIPLIPTAALYLLTEHITNVIEFTGILIGFSYFTIVIYYFIRKLRK
jgi:uncharacterized membrane protein YdjX (TVP38/TMEM64 family)